MHSHLLLHFYPIFQISFMCFQTLCMIQCSSSLFHYFSYFSFFSLLIAQYLSVALDSLYDSNFFTLLSFPLLQILRAKEVCIPEEHSFCSTINSHSDSDVDSDYPNNVLSDGDESRAGEGGSGGRLGGGGGGGRRGRGGGGDMSVVSYRDYRDYDNGKNEELEGEIKWKGRGKKRSDEQTKGKEVIHSIKGRNKKKSGELWMKNQKNCVLQE